MKNQKGRRVEKMGNSDAMSRRGNKSDYYETPWQCVQALIDKVKFSKNTIFLDPCCGKNKVIGNTLRKNGYENIVEKDILYGDDFLQFPEYKGTEEVQKLYHTIIANPPYSIKNDFINKAFKVADTVYMILPANVINYNEFQEKYLDNYLYDGRFLMRPKFFMEEEEKDKPKLGGVSAYAWFVWSSEWVMPAITAPHESWERYIDLRRYF